MKTPTAPGNQAVASNRAASGGDARNQDVDDDFVLQPVRRPSNIENDVTSLGQKKRVSGILRSPDFKEELESVVTDLLRSDRGGGHVIAQAIANVFSPTNRSGPHGIGCVSPINDLTGADTLLYSKGEKLLRCKLAALYRIVDLYGWTSAIFNHITVRVSQEHEHFLINPFGLLYHEVSASKLIKVNMQGEVMDKGSTTLGFNQAGYTLHSAIHAARPDLRCVIHLHTSDVVAVSCMECGLLPISQEALIVGDVSYHNYQGILVDNKEKKSIQKHLGPNNKVMFLRNHGLVACGETVEEAFLYLYNTMNACNIQVKAMSCMKPEKLVQLDRSQLRNRTEEVARKDISQGAEGEAIQWKVGEMLFEAHVRMLDDMGYRSGYSYRNPVIVQHKPRQISDIQLPATAVGHTPVLPEDLEDARGQLRHHDRSQWVNSPNLYTRIVENPEEGFESAATSQNGDVSPRVRTKWKRSDEGSKSSMAVRISNPNQFVPTNTDPREVLATRRSIRGQGRYEPNRPGPQSQLLHSVSPDRLTQGVHSSSKAIIEKGNEVALVTPAGPPNPFNMMNQDGLKEYEKEVNTGSQQEASTGDSIRAVEAAGGQPKEQHVKKESKTEHAPTTSKAVEETQEPRSPTQTQSEKPPAPSVKQEKGPKVDDNIEKSRSPSAKQEKGPKGNEKIEKSRSPSAKQEKGPKGNEKIEKSRSPSAKQEKGPKGNEKIEKSRSSSVKQDKGSKVDEKTNKSPKSGREGSSDDHTHNESGKKKKKRPLSFLKKKR